MSRIAEVRLICIYADGSRQEVVAGVDLPYRTQTGEWACKATLSPMHQLRDVKGEDSFQALCLALSLIKQMLERFQDHGGQILDSGGAPLPLDAEFGRLQ